MGPVAKHIKEIYDAYKKESKHMEPWMDDEDVCSLDPFSGDYWAHCYILPEMFQVYEEEVQNEYNFYMEKDSMPDKFKNFRDFERIYMVFPCYFVPEAEVLRLMAEIGIL